MVIESVLGILLFGLVAFPVLTVVTEVSQTRSELREAGFNIARAWVKAEANNRSAIANEVSLWYETRRGVSVTISCQPDCAEETGSVRVKVAHPFKYPVIGRLIEVVELERDFYAE